MDIRQLRYFVGVASNGSLSAAAERLGVSQPSLSQHMLRIEEDLGIQLFVRTPRGVTLTEGGQRFMVHAGDIIRRFDDAIADMRDRTTEVQGPVRIGLPSSASNVLAVPLAETIRHEFPGITLRAMEAMSGHVQAWLNDGSIDIGILYDVGIIRHLTVSPLLVESLHLVAPSDGWPGAIGPDGIAADAVSLRECAALDLILPNRSHGLRELIERIARQHGIELRIPLEMDSLTQIKRLVERGSGYTILPHAAVSQDLAAGTLVLVPIRNPSVRRTVCLVTNADKPLSRAALEVERAVFHVVAELVRRKLWLSEDGVA